MSDTSKYKELGVDPGKSNVRKIFTKYINNDFPDAFVNIVIDPEDPETVFTMHMDGDGSKIVQRVLHYKETGDASIFQGAVDDALSMNTGDIAASGFITGKWVITDVININALDVPKEIIMEQIAKRFSELIDIYRENGFKKFYFLGGETADLPTQISSMVFDVGIYARTKKNEIISGNVMPGDKIFGFASDGKASWEKTENSGIMSNGVTLARIELMDKRYAEKYPFLNNDKCAYRGKYQLNDKPALLNGVTVSEAILSPTRQWAIVIKKIFDKLKAKNKLSSLHGISMNTGGGVTKIGHVGKGIIYKKNISYVPPIFKLIKEESGESWKNMFETFNCGIGIDVVVKDDPTVKQILNEVSEEIGIACYDLGVCEKKSDLNNRIELNTPDGKFNYDVINF
jgi:phosphoribosylformylglycinamidine cyclo-ligase